MARIPQTLMFDADDTYTALIDIHIIGVRVLGGNGSAYLSFDNISHLERHIQEMSLILEGLRKHKSPQVTQGEKPAS